MVAVTSTKNMDADNTAESRKREGKGSPSTQRVQKSGQGFSVVGCQCDQSKVLGEATREDAVIEKN